MGGGGTQLQNGAGQLCPAPQQNSVNPECLYALIFVCWGLLTFRTHEIFVQTLTAVDSLTCFDFFVRIKLPYGSRWVQNIRK